MQGSAKFGARVDARQHMQTQQPRQMPGQYMAQPKPAMQHPMTPMPNPAAAHPTSRGSGAGPFGAPLQSLPQDVEADPSEVFGGHNGGWKKSGWRS